MSKDIVMERHPDLKCSGLLLEGLVNRSMAKMQKRLIHRNDVNITPILSGCKEHLTKCFKPQDRTIQRPFLLLTRVNIHPTTQNNTM